MRSTFAMALLASTVAFGSSVQAQQLEKKEFNVIGTWNFLTPWQVIEKPFWTEELPKASGGALKGNIKSVTEVNLKGTEVLRLTKQGVFDIAGMVGIYVDDGAAVIEGVDVSGVSRTFQMNREIADLWLDEMQKVMKEKHGAIILAHTTWPEQNFYCRGEIKDINDLKGKKIRVQGTSQADLVAALGGTGVTIAFGEVVPALEKGVVDCGITGTMPAYKAKWQEVTNTLYRLPVGFTVGMWVANLNMWNKLPPATREFMTQADEGVPGAHLEDGDGGVRGGRGLHHRRRQVLGRGPRQAQARRPLRGRSQGARQGARRSRPQGVGQALR